MNRQTYIAPGESLCRPTACKKMTTCARYLAQYVHGRVIDDFSRTGAGMYVPAVCGHPSYAKWLDPAKEKPQEQRAAKEWIGR